MIDPRTQPAIVYSIKSMNCPLTRCEYAGKSTICYLGHRYRDCEIYKDDTLIEDWVKDWTGSSDDGM